MCGGPRHSVHVERLGLFKVTEGISPLCLLVLMMACVTAEEVCRVDVDFAPALEPVPAEDSALGEFC